MTTNERLTLTISTIALVLSALSLWDSHDSSNVHRAEAAPHLAILSGFEEVQSKTFDEMPSVFPAGFCESRSDGKTVWKT